MKPIHQLLRRPGKTVLGVILVALACAVMCVSMGQYYAACQMGKRIQEEYTTIALPTNQYKTLNVLDENGDAVGTTYLSSQPPEVSSVLAGLEENYPALVKSVAHHGFASAYCDSILPVNYTDKAVQAGTDGLTQHDSAPYNCAILAVSIDEFSDLRPYLTEDLLWGDMDPADFGMVADIKGTVTGVYALSDQFEDPTGKTIQIELRLEDEAAFAALDLQTGKEYLVYGSYTDCGWELRQTIADGDQNLFDSLDPENIRMLSDEERELLNKDNSLFGDESEYVAIYQAFLNDEEFGYYLSAEQLANADACRITICPNPSVAMGQLTQAEVVDSNSGGQERMQQETYNQRYRQAGICPIEEADSDELWKTTQASVEINNHAFPVISTGNLKSIAQFATQDARITSGRSFTQEEYESGKSVCVLSESLAVANGLELGDTISIQYYEPDYNLPNQTYLYTANPTPSYYSTVEGFSGEAISYEIVGMYRQSDEWSAYDYSFTPNTIFVPQNSVLCQTETSDSGVFSTIALENGTIEKMEQELENAGYPGLLSYYDQGFSEIEGNLNAYFSVSKKLLLMGILGWVIITAAFLALFPLCQKRNARRMWTLGTPEKQIAGYILYSGSGILIPGSVLGGLISLILLKILPKYMESYASILMDFSLPFLMVLLTAAVQVLLICALTYLVARAVAKRIQTD